VLPATAAAATRAVRDGLRTAMRCLARVAAKAALLPVRSVFVSRSAAAGAAAADDDTKLKVLLFVVKPNGQSLLFNINFAAGAADAARDFLRRLGGLPQLGVGTQRRAGAPALPPLDVESGGGGGGEGDGGGDDAAAGASCGGGAGGCADEEGADDDPDEDAENDPPEEGDAGAPLGEEWV
jgi:hypothetical protein